MNLTDQLTDILNDLQSVWTESSLILGAILLLLVGLLQPGSSIVKGIFVAVIGFALWLNIMSNQVAGLVLMDSLQLSKPSVYFGSLFLLVALLILLFPRDKKHAPEFYFFILSMLAGSLFMMKANSLLITYLSIELVSFSSYILTSFSFKKKGFEAGLKYLLFGAISSATMLFGLGLIYGATGTFTISAFSTSVSIGLLSQVGVVMMLTGIFFKISIVPAHLWVPATYQSAPADATAFISIVPKLAGLVLVQRIFSAGMFSPDQRVFKLVLVLGMLTVVVGTLGAFRQTNARRMISFGAIAHSGYLLPFTLINSETSQDAFWWYAVAYSIMNLAAFYLLDQYERKEINVISDYSNSAKSVWPGISFTLILVSLVGLPPLGGFMAKFFLFSVLWEFYLLMNSETALCYLIVAVLATVGSLFYYLQIPKNIFLSKEEQNQSINFGISAKIIATIFSIGLLLLFFAPRLIMVMQHLLNNVHE